ncbi:Trans-aconitate 2-methyltransferase [Austwickia sp. TVS 96-490-7B]|uniref:class I SAM-dependent methyltransferase n=1 Tax=Austwickia sp. TVS 96-490-7B TaxID=2830843 RepID=UPI001D5F4D1E|nr:class I SAM-dependent methyltransferase [Austwickia sp. TVS 96-490-7B]MBW3084502.1 Trans-aconitate 2-methyltransferase [Austwickia sp. TVS 96-490-7B]
MTREPSQWEKIVADNPQHSTWYVERFREMSRQGNDLDGEARFIDAMMPRGARILDAGCGPGRVGGRLHELGHEVVGVDVDPVLIDAAQQDHPGPRWLVGDLAALDLPDQGIDGGFDAIVCAGNVMTFLAPSSRVEVLRRFRAHLAPHGRAAVGFGAGRGYSFAEFRSDLATAGLVEELSLSTWDLRPAQDQSGFLVAVLRPA